MYFTANCKILFNISLIKQIVHYITIVKPKLKQSWRVTTKIIIPNQRNNVTSLKGIC